MKVELTKELIKKLKIPKHIITAIWVDSSNGYLFDTKKLKWLCFNPEDNIWSYSDSGESLDLISLNHQIERGYYKIVDFGSITFEDQDLVNKFINED